VTSRPLRYIPMWPIIVSRACIGNITRAV